jgi:hypothetical protein
MRQLKHHAVKCQASSAPKPSASVVTDDLTSAQRPPSHDWIKIKNPKAPAVKRVAEIDWARRLEKPVVAWCRSIPLIPPFPGSNPGAPASQSGLSYRFRHFLETSDTSGV